MGKVCLILILVCIMLLGLLGPSFTQTIPRTNTIDKFGPKGAFPRSRVDEKENRYNEESIEDSGETSEKINTSQNDANKFVDDVLRKLRGKIVKKGYNKVNLPSETKEFSRRVLGMKFHGEAQLYNGSLKGLESVHRVHEAEINSLANGSLHLDFDVELENLNISYMITLSFMDRIRTQNLNADLNSVTVHVKLLVDKNGHVNLDQFDITDSGRLRIITRGFGPFNFVINTVADVIGNGVKHVVLESLETDIKDNLNIVINESLYPNRALLALSTMKESVYQKFIKMTKVAKGFFEDHV